MRLSVLFVAEIVVKNSIFELSLLSDTCSEKTLQCPRKRMFIQFVYANLDAFYFNLLRGFRNIMCARIKFTDYLRIDQAL